MLDTLGNILPNAIAIAISPFPIIAVILLLMTARARTLGPAFAGAWFVGVLTATLVTTLLADLVPEPSGATDSQPILGVIKLALGALLVFLGVRKWRSRHAAASAELPSWMAKIDTMGLGSALGFGFLLASVNPKNLLIAAAAGAEIAGSNESARGFGTVLTLALCFALIASLTVLTPVVLTLAAPKRAAEVLGSVHTWLLANNSTIMMVLLFLLGTQVIGKGIASF